MVISRNRIVGAVKRWPSQWVVDRNKLNERKVNDEKL